MYKTSDHYNGKIFLNPVPTEVMDGGSMVKAFKQFLKPHPGRTPASPLGPFTTDLKLLNNLPADQLRITWLGHSSNLVEIDGKRFLTDPLWYQRASPFQFMGPERFFDNPLPIDQLPPIDFILLSHDHYDHLDKHSILKLAAKGMHIITMLGVGKRLRDWGVADKQVVELDWWQTHDIGDSFKITALPARHFSGRWLGDRFSTLWGSFAIKGPRHNVYFGADSGYYNGFTKIGDAYGPFDFAMMDSGAYNKLWESIHMGPENAVQASIDVKAAMLMPIHWGTFSLAFHPWKEPVQRVLQAAETNHVSLLLPRPGETVEVDKGRYTSNWWKEYQ